ncbi:MAG: hypothetical protein ACREKQ_09200 [Candidatus Rokuibacteriota bacterium]
MLRDPGFWLFGLAVALLLAGALGVVLSTRRAPPREPTAVADPDPVPGPGPDLTLVHDLQAEMQRLGEECERLRAERDELRGVLRRLAVLLDRPRPRRAERARVG